MRNRTPQGANTDLGKADPGPVDPDRRPDQRPNRRQALKAFGRFAVYVSPAMTVLLKGDSASADHNPNSNPGHGVDPGRCNNKPWLSIC